MAVFLVPVACVGLSYVTYKIGYFKARGELTWEHVNKFAQDKAKELWELIKHPSESIASLGTTLYEISVQLAGWTKDVGVIFVMAAQRLYRCLQEGRTWEQACNEAVDLVIEEITKCSFNRIGVPPHVSQAIASILVDVRDSLLQFISGVYRLCANLIESGSSFPPF